MIWVKARENQISFIANLRVYSAKNMVMIVLLEFKLESNCK